LLTIDTPRGIVKSGVRTTWAVLEFGTADFERTRLPDAQERKS
jgi:hypothetical protein